MSWFTILWVAIPCVIMAGLFGSRRGQFISRKTKALLALLMVGAALFDMGMTLI